MHFYKSIVLTINIFVLRHSLIVKLILNLIISLSCNLVLTPDSTISFVQNWDNFDTRTGRPFYFTESVRNGFENMDRSSSLPNFSVNTARYFGSTATAFQYDSYCVFVRRSALDHFFWTYHLYSLSNETFFNPIFEASPKINQILDEMRRVHELNVWASRERGLESKPVLSSAYDNLRALFTAADTADSSVLKTLEEDLISTRYNEVKVLKSASAIQPSAK